MTRARWAILGAVLVVLLAVVAVYRQSLVLRIAGMRPFVEDRFDGWVEMLEGIGNIWSMCQVKPVKNDGT